jgi:hypothetical protein
MCQRILTVLLLLFRLSIVAGITLDTASDLCLVKEGSACISISNSGGGGGGGGNHVARAGDVINEVAFLLSPSPSPSTSPLSIAASLSLSSSLPSLHKTISSGPSGCLIFVIQRQHFSKNEFAAAQGTSW